MVLAHTPAQQGDEFPVRLRFAELPAERGGREQIKATRALYQAPPPRQILERGLTTADLRARVDLKAKASVRPPDLDKLGAKQPAKHALAGSSLRAYGEERWGKTFTVRTKNGPRWVSPEDLKYTDIAKPEPEAQPYPWVGRADADLLKWAESARTFRRRERDKALKIANQKLKDSIARIQKNEAALVKVEQRPATRALQAQYVRKAPPPSRTQQQRAAALRRTCPGLFVELEGHSDSSDAVISTSDSPKSAVAAAEFSPSNWSMYKLDGLLFPAACPKYLSSVGEEGTWVSLSLQGVEGGRGKTWKDKLRLDLVTEIAVVLGLAEHEVLVEKIWRQQLDTDAGIARCFRQFDADGDGTLDRKDFKRALAKLGLQLSDEEAGVLFGEYDRDRSGGIQLEEFRQLVLQVRGGLDGVGGGVGALVLLLPEGRAEAEETAEPMSSKLGDSLVKILEDSVVGKITEDASPHQHQHLKGLPMLQLVFDARKIQFSREGKGRADGAGGVRQGGAEWVLAGECEFARFREHVLHTLSRVHAYAFDEVACVLLAAVAAHGANSTTHAFLDRLLRYDLQEAVAPADTACLLHVLLPLALAHAPLSHLRATMAALRGKCERTSKWTRSAHFVFQAAIACTVAAQDALPSLTEEDVQGRVDKVLSQDCPGLLPQAREHILQAYTAAAPFARVVFRAEHLAETLKYAPLTSQHEPQEARGGDSDAEDAEVDQEEAAGAGVGEEEVAEALRLLFDAVKDEYPELLDDAATLACKFLQAVGGLLRSWKPPAAEDAAEAVLEAVSHVGRDVKAQSKLFKASTCNSINSISSVRTSSLFRLIDTETTQAYVSTCQHISAYGSILDLIRKDILSSSAD